jgi:hypothetical protein
MSARPVNFDTLHCDKHPHWSLSVEWRPAERDALEQDGWDDAYPMGDPDEYDDERDLDGGNPR